MLLKLPTSQEAGGGCFRLSMLTFHTFHYNKILLTSGELGDATLKTDEGTTSFNNPDYMADLDAENIAHSIYYDNKSLLEANIHYYDNVLTSQTRAHEFLELVPLTDIKTRIFKELCDKEIRDNESQCMTYLKDYFPDTYNFIKSLENNRQQLGDYI